MSSTNDRWNYQIRPASQHPAPTSTSLQSLLCLRPGRGKGSESKGTRGCSTALPCKCWAVGFVSFSLWRWCWRGLWSGGIKGKPSELEPAVKYQQSALFLVPDYAFSCIAILLLFTYNGASILSSSFNYVSISAPSPSWRALRFIISAWHHSNHLVWFKTLMSSLASLE